MENCLVTKLKAVVDNPNLPILETMQQFTLDAITASGNSSMTDVQKWALNHFFYQIGAISNSGIFAKLKSLVLSFLGGTKNGALTDYAKDVSPTEISNAVTFANGGFSASAANTNICNYNIEYIANESFLFLAGALGAAKVLYPAYRNGTVTLTMVLSSNELDVSSSPYVTFSSFITANLSSFQNVRGGSFAIKDGVATCYIFNDEIIKVGATYHSSEEAEITRAVPRVSTSSNAPFAFACGSGLTEEEQLKFTQEIKTLMDAFTA